MVTGHALGHPGAASSSTAPSSAAAPCSEAPRGLKRKPLNFTPRELKLLGYSSNEELNKEYIHTRGRVPDSDLLTDDRAVGVGIWTRPGVGTKFWTSEKAASSAYLPPLPDIAAPHEESQTVWVKRAREYLDRWHETIFKAALSGATPLFGLDMGNVLLDCEKKRATWSCSCYIHDLVMFLLYSHRRRPKAFIPLHSADVQTGVAKVSHLLWIDRQPPSLRTSSHKGV